MALPSAIESVPNRFSPYIEELHEFFARRGVAFGSPQDMAAFAAALQEPGSFRDEMNSMVRSVVYRERENLPRAELLQLLMFAVGGANVERASDQIHEPVSRILQFLDRAVRSRRTAPPDPPSAPQVQQTLVLPSTAPAMEGAAVVKLPVPSSGALDSPFSPVRSAVGESAPPVPLPHPTTNIFFRARSVSSRPDSPGPPDNVMVFPAPVPAEHEVDPGQIDSAALPAAPRRSALLLALSAVFLVIVAVALTLHHWNVGHMQQGQAAAPGPAATSTSSPHLAGVRQWKVEPYWSADQRTATAATEAAVVPASRLSAANSTAAANGPNPPDVAAQAPAPFAAAAGGPAIDASHPSVAAEATSVATARPARAEPSPRIIQRIRTGLFSVSSGIMAGNLISSPAPEYPRLARFAHIEGQVILQAVVARNGSVVTTHVLRGHRLLRSAAKSAVRRWRYRPYVVDGRPTVVATIITVDFRLHQ